VLERRDPVDPGLDAVAPVSGPVDLEGAGPLVITEQLERRLAPARRAGRLVADGGAEELVPVAEDAGRHVDAVAHGALHRVAPAVDLRRHPLDLNARRRLVGLRKWHVDDPFRGYAELQPGRRLLSRVKRP